MRNNRYSLRYLPKFYEELDETVTYIAEQLSNPRAANDLLDEVETAILERLPVAESFEPYHSAKERKYKYYRIYVNNFTMYYVVIDDEADSPIMEVRRFFYRGQNQIKMI
jgi:toxin ParE1/3/4